MTLTHHFKICPMATRLQEFYLRKYQMFMWIHQIELLYLLEKQVTHRSEMHEAPIFLHQFCFFSHMIDTFACTWLLQLSDLLLHFSLSVQHLPLLNITFITGFAWDKLPTWINKEWKETEKCYLRKSLLRKSQNNNLSVYWESGCWKKRQSVYLYRWFISVSRGFILVVFSPSPQLLI